MPTQPTNDEQPPPKSERKNLLLGAVMDVGRVEVAQLAADFGVSQVTVRKDLNELEAQGLLRREHGFAVVGSSDDMRTRLAVNYPVKQQIARAAAEIVGDGETVMIESGSVCAILAEELCTNRRGVTLITNSAFIADFVRKIPQSDVLLLGGAYQPESQVCVGPLIAAMTEKLYVDKLFVGIDGFTPRTGFTGRDVMRAEAVRRMARSAERVIVLSETRKFQRRGAVQLFETAEVSEVFTEGPLETEVLADLHSHDVTVTQTHL
ncbi:DeoR/GlpR family DNA-binding transcription regulator [Arachnia propionica]|uniref:Lactose phosphotransferase system repressor n=1 Tax=Arachnia propionica TaxID=1750 RepID=A0A3P1WRJ1_9ACTN|nr:DeoR/GlpR family DNA-binding transcription regulator [Arachnia propionica]RRD48915.1 DeoR/GlpR transcriptional regulator [Arachnia propionica]